MYGSNAGFRYVLPTVDAYSRFIVFTPLRDKCAATVTKVMLKYKLSSLNDDSKLRGQNIFHGSLCQFLEVTTWISWQQSKIVRLYTISWATAMAAQCSAFVECLAYVFASLHSSSYMTLSYKIPGIK